MKRHGIALWVYSISAGLVLTGLAWLALHDVFIHQGQFGPEPWPAEPWLLKAHGALAMLALFGFGRMWRSHIEARWRVGNRRWSGGVLVGVTVLLLLTGYLLYYVGGETLRSVVSASHWVIGLLAPLVLGVHRLRRRASSSVD